MNLMTLEHATKSFGSHVILKDVSLSIEKGKVISLIGSSGSGKTTLLNCLTLLDELDNGRLVYDNEEVIQNTNGQPVYRKDLREIRKKFSLVFQNFNLFPHRNVLENLIDAPILVLKRNRKETEEKALALLEKFGLKDRASFYPYQCSGGQKQRIAIIRALMMEPEIIFFDEPTSALDPEYTMEVLKVIEKLKEENMTLFIVSHEMDFVRRISDEVLYMDKGEIVEKGTPEEIFNAPKDERTAKFLNNYRLDNRI